MTTTVTWPGIGPIPPPEDPDFRENAIEAEQARKEDQATAMGVRSDEAEAYLQGTGDKPEWWPDYSVGGGDPVTVPPTPT
jgi:hypothetical protein